MVLATSLLLLLTLSSTSPLELSCDNEFIIGFDELELDMICKLRMEIGESELNEPALVGHLIEIEALDVSDRVKRRARSDLRRHFGLATIDWWTALLDHSRADARELAVSFLGTKVFPEISSQSAADALAVVAMDDRRAAGERASALWYFSATETRPFTSPELFSLVGNPSVSLSETAAFVYVRPQCELWERDHLPSGFESTASTWLRSPQEDIRVEAALCLLAGGGESFFEASHPLVSTSVGIAGAAALDNTESPLLRGRSIDALALWGDQNQEASRYLKRMFDRTNWFYGAAGAHEVMHSLMKLYLVLVYGKEPAPAWAIDEFEALLEDEAEVMTQEGGDRVISLVRNVMGNDSVRNDD